MANPEKPFVVFLTFVYLNGQRRIATKHKRYSPNHFHMNKLNIFLGILFLGFTSDSMAANGDSIFNMTYIHQLHITFPYSNFYDSLIWSHANDTYLSVDIDFNGQIYNQVGIKAKGNSSFNGPGQKKSFKLDLNRFVSGQDMHGLKKINFNNSFKDPSFMREKLCNDFLIEHQLPAPRTTYCNVYMNNQLWGLYVVVEEVDDEFCESWFGNKDGNLFKGDPHGDLRWKGSSAQNLYEADYELQNNSSLNNWGDLINLIDLINNTPANTLEQTLESAFNTNNFLKQWAAMNLFSSLDSYLGSGHNYYVYHDILNNRFEWIAWDNNEAFGSFKQNLSTTQLKNLDMYYVSQPASNRPLIQQMLNSSYYHSLYDEAFCMLKQDFDNQYFDQRIDSIRQVIQASVYADPKKQYSNGKFDSSFQYDLMLNGPGGITVFGLKNFVNTKQTAVTNQLLNNNIYCSPLLSNDWTPNDFNIYPQPFQDGFILQNNRPLERIQIFDIMGRAIYEKQASGGMNSITIGTANWPSGIYLLRVNGKYVSKLSKQ